MIVTISRMAHVEIDMLRVGVRSLLPGITQTYRLVRFVMDRRCVFNASMEDTLQRARAINLGTSSFQVELIVYDTIARSLPAMNKL